MLLFFKRENRAILNCLDQGTHHSKWWNISQVMKNKWYLDADWKRIESHFCEGGRFSNKAWDIFSEWPAHFASSTCQTVVGLGHTVEIQ